MVQTAIASRQLHLIDAEPAGGEQRRVLRIPEGLSRLRWRGDDAFELVPDGASAPDDVVVEPVTRHRELRLLIAAPPGTTLRVNGAAVGRVAAAGETDVVQIGDGGRGLLVAVYVRSVIGTAPEARAEERCIVCKRPLGEAVVYICSVCGHAVHCDAAGGEPAGGCMLSRNCASCQTPVRTQGYATLPEDALS